MTDHADQGRSSAPIVPQPEETSQSLIASDSLGIAEKPRWDVGDLLSRKDIEDMTGISASRLRAFADIPGIGEYLGAVDVKGAKGVRYLPRAMEQFRRLAQAQDEGIITPKTAKNWLQNVLESPSEAKPQSLSGEGKEELSLSVIAPLAAAIERLAAAQGRALPPPEDRLIGRQEAAELLACKPGAVSLYVKPVRRSAWKRSDVLRHIAGL